MLIFWDPETNQQGQEKLPATNFYELNKNIETVRNNDGASVGKNYITGEFLPIQDLKWNWNEILLQDMLGYYYSNDLQF